MEQLLESQARFWDTKALTTSYFQLLNASLAFLFWCPENVSNSLTKQISSMESTALCFIIVVKMGRVICDPESLFNSCI